MRVVSMEVFPITLTLVSPIAMSSGVIQSTNNVVVKLTSEDGVIGWGEGVEAPALTGQSQVDILADLESLRDFVVGSDAGRVTAIWAGIRAALPDASTALGAIDIALHDLVGRTLGLPANMLLGGRIRDTIPALTLVGSGDAAADAATLARRHEAGYSWFKVKLGMAAREVEWQTLAAALDVVGEHGVVCGDANEAWTEVEASSFLSGLDGMPVRFVEQPVSREADPALLRIAASSPVPICADESAGSLRAVVGFAGTPLGGVSLKLIKHGGMTGVMRGAAICAEAGLNVNLAGKVIESSISAAANLHCASAMSLVEYGCSPANLGTVSDVTEHPIGVADGEFAVPVSPGLGVEVDEDMVRSLRT